MSATDKAGHTFLASLGKTRLRPGGVEATEWLFSQSQLTPDSQVLEVACNMATTAIELVQRFGCTVYAIDMEKPHWQTPEITWRQMVWKITFTLWQLTLTPFHLRITVSTL